MAAYLLKIDKTGESRPLDLPIEDVLLESRVVALTAGSKVFVHRVSDGKKLAASGVGQGTGGVSPKDIDATDTVALMRGRRKRAEAAVANLRKVPRRKRQAW